MATLNVEQAFVFFLLLLRITGIIIFIPLFGDVNVPPTIKLLLSISITYFFFRIFQIQEVSFSTLNALEIFLFIIKEFALGVIIGYLFRLTFFIVSASAEAVSQTSGFAASRMFNPQMNQTSSVIGDLFFFMAVFMFFAVKGEVLLLRVIHHVCTFIPLGHLEINEGALKALIGTGSLILQIAARLAGPFLFCILLVNMGMGIAGRLVPTLNVMALSFTITLAASLWLIWLFLPFYVNAIDGIFNNSEHLLFQILGGMGG